MLLVLPRIFLYVASFFCFVFCTNKLHHGRFSLSICFRIFNLFFPQELWSDPVSHSVAFLSIDLHLCDDWWLSFRSHNRVLCKEFITTIFALLYIDYPRLMLLQPNHNFCVKCFLVTPSFGSHHFANRLITFIKLAFQLLSSSTWWVQWINHFLQIYI